MSVPRWWRQPRRVSVLVDNASWVLPYAETLVAGFAETGEQARLCRDHDELAEDGVAFFLGCIRVAPQEVLARNHRNLVVHASELPRGRGFSPLTWQIIEGRNVIPVCLLEAVDDVDAGPVVYRDPIHYEGHELIDELREALGRKTIELCRRYLGEPTVPEGSPQRGDSTHYPRRRPADSRLDPEKSLAAQFDLMRTVDNARYPAFFELRGKRYSVAISKTDE